jgi:hypothetical protein
MAAVSSTSPVATVAPTSVVARPTRHSSSNITMSQSTLWWIGAAATTLFGGMALSFFVLFCPNPPLVSSLLLINLLFDV